MSDDEMNWTEADAYAALAARRDMLMRTRDPNSLEARRNAMMDERKRSNALARDPWYVKNTSEGDTGDLNGQIERFIGLRGDALIAALSSEQRKFVRQAEFVVYLKVLDTLIQQFDRANRFDLFEGIDKTIAQLSKLRTSGLLRRELIALEILGNPALPKTLFQRLLRGTFIRYINWKAALDLK